VRRSTGNSKTKLQQGKGQRTVIAIWRGGDEGVTEGGAKEGQKGRNLSKEHSQKDGYYEIQEIACRKG